MKNQNKVDSTKNEEIPSALNGISSFFVEWNPFRVIKMMKRIWPFRIACKNRCELCLSFVLVVIAVFHWAIVPRGYKDSFILASSLVAGLVFALDVVLDKQKTSTAERIIGLAWFLILLFVTSLVLWDLAHIEVFSPR